MRLPRNMLLRLCGRIVAKGPMLKIQSALRREKKHIWKRNGTLRGERVEGSRGWGGFWCERNAQFGMSIFIKCLRLWAFLKGKLNKDARSGLYNHFFLCEKKYIIIRVINSHCDRLKESSYWDNFSTNVPDCPVRVFLIWSLETSCFILKL